MYLKDNSYYKAHPRVSLYSGIDNSVLSVVMYISTLPW